MEQSKNKRKKKKMKRLMLAMATAIIAATVQAASVSWSTVAMFDDTGTGSKVKDGAKVYVYLMDKTTYDGMTDIWASYGADVLAGGSNAANAGGSATGKYTNKATVSAPKDTAVANTAYYAAIITTFGTGDAMKYYAEKASVTTGDDGNASFSAGIGKLDSATAAAGAWTTASVPEPTSGLLMLLGIAGLALRRRRA